MAFQGELTLTLGVWTLISTTNCTFQVRAGSVEILGTVDAAPAASDVGLAYGPGEGDGADVDTIARFPGIGTANRIYAKATMSDTRLFVSSSA